MTTSPLAESNSRWHRVSQDLGAPVFDRSGHRVAVLKFFVCERADDIPCYAVLSTEGFLGPGPDCRPVPAHLLVRSNDTPGFVLDVDQDIFLDGPRYLDGSNQDFEEDWSEADVYFAEGFLRLCRAQLPRPQIVRI